MTLNDEILNKFVQFVR